MDAWQWWLAALVPFAVLVNRHRAAAAREDAARGAVAAAGGSLARMDRDWANMPALQSVDLHVAPNRAAIRDLDVFGERSLYRLLDVGQASVGGAVLMRWLLDDPAAVDVIRERQASVGALRQRPDYLLESARLCRSGTRPLAAAKLAAFRRWCEQPVRSFSPVAVLAARVVTAAFIVTLIAVAVVGPDLRMGLARIAVILAALQFAVAIAARRHLRATLGDAADMLPDLIALRGVLHAVSAEREVAGRFGEIQRALAGDATRAFDTVARLLEWNAVRHSPMLHSMVNALVAFDAHLASRIDRWRLISGARVPAWIDLAGEAQALTALATAAYENPGWVVPMVHDDDAPVMRATACGHPLLDAARVTNSVALESPSTAVVISGSNMSGKTTYLRAVGLNALLALAGGAVCATAASVRRCRTRTSVRIEDDLGAGVSLFLAEVSRIRDVVADAEADGPPVLFLFDEILHGTNAHDRREASRLVLRRLLAAGAAGVITTHDATIGDIGTAGVTYAHFTDTVRREPSGVAMTFDYVMRPGPATSANALRLLEALGLVER